MQEFFYIRYNRKFVQIRFADVVYCEAKGNYVKLVCKSKSYIVSRLISEVCKALPKNLFCRIHKSYLVAIQKVKEFDQETVLLETGMMLPMSEFYLSSFKKRVLIISRVASRKLETHGTNLVEVIPFRTEGYSYVER